MKFNLVLILLFSFGVITSQNEELKDEFKFPIFRGCNEKLSNEAQKLCTQNKIGNFIKLSFDYEIADKALPLEKSTRFKIEFTINKKGKVENVTAHANHRDIAVEAIKTAKRLPKFKKPAMRNGKAVDTPFSMYLTIYF